MCNRKKNEGQFNKSNIIFIYICTLFTTLKNQILFFVTNEQFYYHTESSFQYFHKCDPYVVLCSS